MKKRRQWEWVKKRAMKINEFIAKGYLVLVLDDEGEGSHKIMTTPLTITESNKNGNPEVYHSSGNCNFMWYEHSSDWDHGYFDSRKQLHEDLFARIRVYKSVGATPFKSKVS